MTLLDAELAKYENFTDIEWVEWLRENPPDLIRFPLTDHGNARRMHAAHGRAFRYVSERDKWIKWNGNNWEFDELAELQQRFIDTMNLAVDQFAKLPTPDEPEEKKRHEGIGQFLAKNGNKDRITNALHLLRWIPGMMLKMEQLDANPLAIGTPRGTINLQTGEAETSTMTAYITKRVAVDYNPRATCPRWDQFLVEITPNHPELISYLQRAVGYSLTGSVKEECLFFLSGEGQNGKGTFVETIQRLLLDYSKTASMSLFIKDPHGNSSGNYDIASIAGKRFVSASELEEGAHWDETKIKSITGGDTINARQIYEAPFDFQPQHKLWVSGNRKPLVKGTDHGIWRRLKLIQFNADFRNTKNDPNLKATLLTELPGILRWAVQGALEWQRIGLFQPACVTQWTEEYKRDEDTLGQFISDRMVTCEGGRVPFKAVYHGYEEWAEANGIKEKFRLSMIALSKKIRSRGMEMEKTMGGQVVLGWALSDYGNSEGVHDGL